MENSVSLLERFLNTSIGSGDALFELFSALPGAVYNCGDKPFERYAYVPGSREDRVVLVAHADTVWDKNYGHDVSNHAVCVEGIFTGTDTKCGIGADDRAGCAMLWALKDCGHSILLVDGEEHGKIGARFLRRTNRKLFRELNQHNYMIELDWQGTVGCLFNQVENTKVFKEYITNTFGFHDDQKKGGCDLQVLCSRICGTNIGIGYHGYHTAKESLVVAEWENTYCILKKVLENPQPKFSIPVSGILRNIITRIKGKFNKIMQRG